MSIEHQLMMPGQLDRQYAQKQQSDSQNDSNEFQLIQNKSSISLSKQIPIKTFMTSQLDSNTISINQHCNNTEEHNLQQNDKNAIYDQNFQEHRQFLSLYKKQRQQELKKSKFVIKTYKHSQSNQITQKPRCHSMIQSCNQSTDEKIQQNQKYIIDKMNQIHNRIQMQMISLDADCKKRNFKLFTNAIQIKSDIGRVDKQQRFIKSQQSKYLEYEEPKIIKNNQYRRQFRIRTEGIYDQSQLSRQAQQFTDRIQKQQQVLLGNHLMRKKLQQKKRARHERQQIRKCQQMNEFKRQERKLKAEQHLMLMKHKAKIAQLINHNNQDQLKTFMNQQTETYNSRYMDHENSQIQFKHHQLTESNRISSDMNKNLVQHKRWKLQDLKLSTNPTNLTERELNLREKIANKKNKLFKPKTVNLTQQKEDISLDRKSAKMPLQKCHSISSDIENPKYPDSDNCYQSIKDEQSLKNREPSQCILFTNNQQRDMEMNHQIQRQQVYPRQKQDSIGSMQ